MQQISFSINYCYCKRLAILQQVTPPKNFFYLIGFNILVCEILTRMLIPFVVNIFLICDSFSVKLAVNDGMKPTRNVQVWKHFFLNKSIFVAQLKVNQVDRMILDLKN